MFLNKTRKENVSGEIRFRSRGDVLGTYAPSLKTEKTARGSLTVGPEGPLVRFDRSSLPPLSLPERWRPPAIAVAERRLLEGI